MTALDHPFDWHLHIFWTWPSPPSSRGLSDGDPGRGLPTHPRQRRFFTLGVVALLVALMWPLGDLAAHWSLLALVLQRLFSPSPSRPFWSPGRRDRSSYASPGRRRRCRPAPRRQARAGRGIVTVVAVGTLTTGVVSLAAHSDVARRGDPARRPSLGLRPLGAGPHRTAGLTTPLGSGPGRLPDRAVHRAELPLGRLDLRPPLALCLLRPPHQACWACRRPRPAAGRLPGQAEHHRRALDRGLHPDDPGPGHRQAPTRTPNR
jgi:hypothetical protein